MSPVTRNPALPAQAVSSTRLSAHDKLEIFNWPEGSYMSDTSAIRYMMRPAALGLTANFRTRFLSSSCRIGFDRIRRNRFKRTYETISPGGPPGTAKPLIQTFVSIVTFNTGANTYLRPAETIASISEARIPFFFMPFLMPLRTSASALLVAY